MAKPTRRDVKQVDFTQGQFIAPGPQSGSQQQPLGGPGREGEPHGLLVVGLGMNRLCEGRGGDREPGFARLEPPQANDVLHGQDRELLEGLQQIGQAKGDRGTSLGGEHSPIPGDGEGFGKQLVGLGNAPLPFGIGHEAVLDFHRAVGGADGQQSQVGSFLGAGGHQHPVAGGVARLGGGGQVGRVGRGAARQPQRDAHRPGGRIAKVKKLEMELLQVVREDRQVGVPQEGEVHHMEGTLEREGTVERRVVVPGSDRERRVVAPPEHRVELTRGDPQEKPLGPMFGGQQGESPARQQFEALSRAVGIDDPHPLRRRRGIVRVGRRRGTMGDGVEHRRSDGRRPAGDWPSAQARGTGGE